MEELVTTVQVQAEVIVRLRAERARQAQEIERLNAALKAVTPPAPPPE